MHTCVSLHPHKPSSPISHLLPIAIQRSVSGRMCRPYPLFPYVVAMLNPSHQCVAPHFQHFRKNTQEER
ncbi:hypothetical protein BaRGS_00026863 [Batillaria attramentaria]|uniref:Uncharacterized protein n=1 Tax=Batillaria attramentaria TaxID=370345 RepID=A0ABD0K354_9CAEN